MRRDREGDEGKSERAEGRRTVLGPAYMQFGEF